MSSAATLQLLPVAKNVRFIDNACINEFVKEVLDLENSELLSGGRVNLVQEAYDRLKDEILESRLPPGVYSPEPEIAARLGMSRTPVREALLRLEADGLVELVPRRGARIVPVSIDDMREIYEILTALEPEAAAHVALNHEDDDELSDLIEATDDMERAIAEDDLDAWAAADNRFHRRLLNLHNNKRMTEFILKLFDQTHRVRNMTLRLRKKPTRSTREHRKILQLMKARNADRTRDVFRWHRQRAANELLTILENYRLPSA